jgi:hypothetical protein
VLPQEQARVQERVLPQVQVQVRAQEQVQAFLQGLLVVQRGLLIYPTHHRFEQALLQPQQSHPLEQGSLQEHLK